MKPPGESSRQKAVGSKKQLAADGRGLHGSELFEFLIRVLRANPRLNLFLPTVYCLLLHCFCSEEAGIDALGIANYDEAQVAHVKLSNTLDVSRCNSS